MSFGLVDSTGNTYSYSKVIVYGADGKVKYPAGGGSGTVTSVGFSAGTGISLSGTNPITTSGIITIINSAPDQTVVLTASTGISVSGTYPSFTLTNTLPDQVVALTAGTSIGITGTYPNFTISNLAPDVAVALTAGTGISISGTYPNFTITNTSPSSGGTVTSVQLNAGTGISLSGTNPITASGIITVTNSAPDQIVALTAGTGIGVSGTYPNFTITNSAPFATPLTTKGDIYVRNATVDTRLPIGLDTQILVADSSTATGIKWTSQPAATPTGYYGAFYDLTTQTAAAINTPYAMKFSNTDLSNGVSIVSNSRITIANTGVYNIQFSAQFYRTNGGTDVVDIWIRKNGIDVPATDTQFVMSGSALASQVVPAWNFVVNAVGGDYYELMWATPDTHIELLYAPAQTSPFSHPAIPSVILTVTQQSGIMAGTGITAINSLTGAVQTLATGTTGTDFGISSSGTAHTFNLPIASATNTGKLSSTDWSTFNNKVPQTRTITINGTAQDLSADRSWTVTSTNYGTLGINLALNVVASTTTYNFVNGGPVAYGTEATRYTALPFNATFTGMVVATASAQSVTGSLTITLRIAGANTAVSVVIAAGSAANFFTIGSLSVAYTSGQALSLMFVNAATATSAQVSSIILTYTR